MNTLDIYTKHFNMRERPFTLVPDPVLSLPVTGNIGATRFDVSVIRSLPAGRALYLQAFFADPTAAQGLAASDAVQTTTL